jgi:hypothetical protein
MIPTLRKTVPRLATRIIGLLQLFTALTAIYGGLALVLDPSGGRLQLPAGTLSGSPFSTFLWPGLTLLVVIGFGNGLAGLLTLSRRPLAAFSTAFFGAGLMIWVACEWAWIPGTHGLQFFYFFVGLTLFCAGVAWAEPSAHRLQPPPPRRPARPLA